MKLNTIIQNITLLIISLIIVISLILYINKWPALYFDEGWVMSIAHNWIKYGHYCQLLNGNPITASPMLNIGFPAIGPIALSFASFGVGIWQGRLPSVIFALGSFFLLYQIAKYLYGQVIATATLIIAIFILPVDVNPITIGRQALGEMPSMFYLLAGYFSLMFAWENLLMIPLAALFYALAMVTKQQVVPFLFISLLIPLVILAFDRDWKQCKIIGSVIIATIIGYQIMAYVQKSLVGASLPAVTRTQLYLTSAFVPVLKVRFFSLYKAIKNPSIILGLGYMIYGIIRNQRPLLLRDNVQIIQLSLVVLTVTWFTWFILLSIGWIRYLFPIAFMSTIFFGLFLSDLTNGFKSCRALIGVLVFLILVNQLSSLASIYRGTVNSDNPIIIEVANFINTKTSQDALIETYDMELFPFLKRRYHYPPDLIQLQLNRRRYMLQDVQINYNPIPANPDYLIVGPKSAEWELYDHILESAEFRYIKKFNGYTIYSRVRNAKSSQGLP